MGLDRTGRRRQDEKARELKRYMWEQAVPRLLGAFHCHRPSSLSDGH
jgi:hypothetical protein